MPPKSHAPSPTLVASPPGQREGRDSARSKARAALRENVTQSLRDQGFDVTDSRIVPADLSSKDAIRALHEQAVQHAVERARPGLERHEPVLLDWIARGDEIDPERLSPRLVEVQPRSEEELVFRWVRLHWSIPVSAGYGRRLRFLVVDEVSGKLIGIIGLGDPVFAMKARDQAIGWSIEQRRKRLRHVMDAFVLGAVPPYSFLRCGKLVALLAASNEVRDAFARKYGRKTPLIATRTESARLAMITTTSALGRSSLYNRLKFGNERVYRAVGFTAGFGDFQFMNGLYADLRDYAEQHLTPTAKHPAWGHGFRNRRELVRLVLRDLELSTDWQHHGVERQVFLVPTAANSERFLRGDAQRLRYWDRPASALSEFFLARWYAPRARSSNDYRDFAPGNYRLWYGSQRP